MKTIARLALAFIMLVFLLAAWACGLMLLKWTVATPIPTVLRNYAVVFSIGAVVYVAYTGLRDRRRINRRIPSKKSVFRKKAA